MLHRLPEVIGLATLALGMVALVLSVAYHVVGKDNSKGNNDETV
jgi:hypothetical protein